MIQGGQVTRNSIKEYAEAIKARYGKATKAGKSKILDEFTKTTGLHRKATIRLLNHRSFAPGRKRSGRPPRYGIVVTEALRTVWEASDRLCSKRLHPFLPELLEVMRKCGESKMTAEIEVELCRMSPATIDRLLYPWKLKGGRRSFSATRESTQECDTHPHLCGLEGEPPWVYRSRSGGTLWRKFRRFLFEYSDGGRCGHRLVRVYWSMGERTTTSRYVYSPNMWEATFSITGIRLRQR
jgi:hypothetical protein